MAVAATLTLFPALVLAAVSGDLAGTGQREGTIQIAKKSVKVTVDPARNRNGEWVGSLALPEQQLTGVPFSKISVKDGSVNLESRGWLLGVDAKLSPDGQSIEGDFLSAFLLHVPVPWRLQRVAEPRINASTGISKDLEGAWDGVVKLGASWEDDDSRTGSTVPVRVNTGQTGRMASPSARSGDRVAANPSFP